MHEINEQCGLTQVTVQQISLVCGLITQVVCLLRSDGATALVSNDRVVRFCQWLFLTVRVVLLHRWSAY